MLQKDMNEAYQISKQKELDMLWELFFYGANMAFNVVWHLLKHWNQQQMPELNNNDKDVVDSSSDNNDRNDDNAREDDNHNDDGRDKNVE